MGQTKTLMTAEEFLEKYAGRRIELVQGELVEISPVDLEHSEIVIVLGSWLITFVKERKLGHVGTECGFILARNPDVIRAPDLHFIASARLGSEPSGFFAGAPDLAVEVASRYDKVAELQKKIHEYLTAGTRLVWLVDPRSKTVTAYHPPGEARVFVGDQEVTGEDLIPGFSFRPSALFDR